jgi:hypothetical protein
MNPRIEPPARHTAVDMLRHMLRHQRTWFGGRLVLALLAGMIQLIPLQGMQGLAWTADEPVAGVVDPKPHSSVVPSSARTTPALPVERPVSALSIQNAAAAEPVAETLFTPEITANDLRPAIEFLAGSRLAGRSGAGAALAAEYLVDQFRQMKLQPLFPDRSFVQSIPGGRTADGRELGPIGRNVGAFLPGSDPQLEHEYVVIGVHFDHLGTRDGHVFAGADDNASGTAMMLAVARRWSQSAVPPRRTMVFIGFDLEEHMLWGSRWFAAHPPWPLEQVKLFITADMIGRSLGNLPLPAVFVMGAEHAPRLGALLDATGRPPHLEVARLGIDLIGTRSDYGPFRDRQVPFLFFSTGEHPDYHTPRDTPDRLDFDKAALVSSLIWRLTQQVAQTDSPPVWTDQPARGLDEARALARITTLLLEAGERYPLSDLQRYMVSTVRNRCRRILDAGTMTAEDRTWLIRMSQLLLLSVF